MKIFYVLLDLYERVEDEQAKDGCMENKQVKDAAEDALGLDLTDMAKMYPGGFLLELSETIDGIEQTLQYSIEERNELFLDLAENYRREGLYEKYLEPVAQLAEQLSEQGIDEEVVKEWQEFEVQFLKYQPLMRRFLLTELYADSLKPEGNLEEMVVQVQWIAMEYATIRHAVFLHWLLSQGEGSFCEEGISTSCRRGISYEDVRDYMVVVSRMTGYEEDDIYEYLENSFEHIIWDWGYFALICG
jgi:lysine-N-methylase